MHFARLTHYCCRDMVWKAALDCPLIAGTSEDHAETRDSFRGVDGRGVDGPTRHLLLCGATNAIRFD